MPQCFPGKFHFKEAFDLPDQRDAVIGAPFGEQFGPPEGHVFVDGVRALPVHPTAQHDAVDPVGFVIHHQAKRLGLVSDAGFVTRNMTKNLRGLNGLFVEANYDEGLLEADTKRPWSIKQRISSRHGHLSNAQVMDLVREIAHPALSRVVLGHLSSDCNVPHLALSLLRECLTTLGHGHTEIHCACPHKPSEWFAL